ncbi:hypothetical protein EB796_013095 [Bugula neritina]|uniref:Uncharacterized protein n=1 Tax=Bugula neritina TaxID=10212 RepID=A0A7J7JQG3_BUGNE|nr:hypothetical protein EB796_013095 [Bugula neritina]
MNSADSGLIYLIESSRNTDKETDLVAQRLQSITLSGYFELDFHSYGSKFTNTGIYEAIKKCNLFQLQRCIEYGENVHLIDEEFGTSYVMLVVSFAEQHTESKYLPMLHELAMASCDVNSLDMAGNSALSECIKKNLEDMMVSLLQLGAEGSKHMVKLIDRHSGPFYMQTKRWYEKHTPSLRQAIVNEDIRAIKRLLSHWCRVNIKHNGVSLHEEAVKLYGRQHIICDLLESHYHTMELIHSALAGNKKRVLDFKTNYRCDYNWLNRGYQKNVLKPLEPRSIYDAVKSLGHTHLLDVVPQPSISPSASDRTSENEGVTSRLCVIS